MYLKTTEYLEGSLFTHKDNCYLFKHNREKIISIGLHIFAVSQQICEQPAAIPQLFLNGQKTDIPSNYIQQDPDQNFSKHHQTGVTTGNE